MEVLNHLITFFAEYGYIAVFCVLVLCGIGLPVPEDITLLAGGIICGLSKYTPYPINVNIMVIVGISGVLIGDGIIFGTGRFFNKKVTRYPLIGRLITPKNYAIIQSKVKRYGDKMLFLARFLPGLRAPIFLIYGISRKINIIKFIIMDGLAALISVPLIVYLGYIFANDSDTIFQWIHNSEITIAFGILTVIAIVLLFNFIKQRKK
jgi:membrane protein DedA with SNARE-associated domain